ncbi:protein EARLY STARVATION 1, chloroplastic [Magnolia sinica]|uniref:protein EARLY STARVATION 1, chloroplastic n=1 Tax=Magnolia sinica TaxID=86752 RepID=UPI0026586200|nr:protein EARLY STARVATION 1, chloroplastic [Magnolia sinica]
MEASSRGLAAPFSFRIRKFYAFPLPHHGLDFRVCGRDRPGRLNGFRCCCSETEFRKLAPAKTGKNTEKKVEEWPFEPKKMSHRRGRIRAMPLQPFSSPRPRDANKKDEFHLRCTPRNSGPQSRDTPPKRDTGIANEKDWGINLVNEKVNESGTNEDGSTWFRESGEEVGENGYRCRWTRMGGRCRDGSSEWKETWWEKSDWTGYKELGVEKSGENAEGDSWWETWQEVLHQDEWSNLARIERSAQKQAKSGNENAGWYEKWWEKYDAKGWTEKGAHKYGRLNEQSWWEKWGEHYDGRGSVLKWTDKWAETELGTKWGDKWEEKFFAGIGSRQGETWHVSPTGDRWSRTWGEEHFGNGKVHKYGKSTTGESWDIVVDEETYYEAEPHYGWADVVGNSSQLLSIQPRERPPGVYPNLDFGPSPPTQDDPDDPPDLPPSSQ